MSSQPTPRLRPACATRRAPHAAHAAAAAVAALGALTACNEAARPRVIAKQVSAREELIGGPGALGEVGDWLLANDQIRVIVQGSGYSRGFGVYGGALIDADLNRPRAQGTSAGGEGNDRFGEMVPAFFLKAMAPIDGGIDAQTLEDGTGVVRVAGRAADFLFQLQRINGFLLGEGNGLTFQNEYRLAPGKRYVEIITRVTNVSETAVPFPGDGIDTLLMGGSIDLPLGDVLLFGAKNKLFAPGAGFDLRFTLEALYRESTRSLPQLPGLVTPFLASTHRDISYGFASATTDPAASFLARTGYEGARPDDILIPFVFSGFTGAFYGAAPKLLEPRDAFEFKKYLIVGTGDVASIRDVVHEIRGYTTGKLAGWVRNTVTRAPEAEVSIVTLDASGKPYNQHLSSDEGLFVGTYEPGRYSYQVVAEGRFVTPPVPFEIVAGQQLALEIDLPQPGWVSVRTLGEDGRPLPAKCSFVSSYEAAATGMNPMEFLYSLKLGEHRRPVDLRTDDGLDPSSREYLEHVTYTTIAEVTEPVRPGSYRVVCSRGIEYDVVETQIEVKAGQIARVEAVLPHALPTPGWVSGDYHLHATNSIDSAMNLVDRLTTVAAEGVDVAVATDHNFVTDYNPAIASANLEPFIQGVVGLEMTTLEVGHFNGFPLRYKPGPITKGAFEWSGRAPSALFEDLRALGKYGPEQTIIQINHPRDAILGYFNNYFYNPDTGEAEDSTSLFLAAEGPEFGKDQFSLAVDAIELYNGKRFDLLRTYRVPEVLPPPPLPMNVPPAGSILRDADGKVAFPGGMDDWFGLLDKDVRLTAVANSDSHESEDEAGYPRTYTPVSDDRPGYIPELDLVRAMKSQKALLTNGPMLDVKVGGKGLGETADGSSGKVSVQIAATAAPWIDLTSVSVIVNGETLRTFTGSRAELAALPAFDVDVARDSWIVVEARGDRSMWPVVTPLEVPPIQLNDAVGSIAGSFGIDLNPFGNLQPKRIGVVRPYAFTNPIFVDRDGDGVYRGPGVRRQALTAREPRSSVKRTDLKKVPTLLKIFATFNCH
jgi:hypothetical protein